MIKDTIEVLLKEIHIRDILISYVNSVDMGRVPSFLSNIYIVEEKILMLENRLYIEQAKTINSKKK